MNGLRQISRKIQGIFLICIILLLNACQTNSAIDNNVVSPEPSTPLTITQEVTSIHESVAPGTETTESPAHSFTPTPVRTTPPAVETEYFDPTELRTRPPVETLPAFSPLPTLTSNEIEETILDLLQNNAGCRLPCWWGATPGQTQWDEVDVFLASLNAEYYEPHSRFHEIHLPNVPDALSIEDPLGLQIFYNTERNIIQIIDVTVAPSPRYFLHSILTDYGPPAEVLIDTMPAPRKGFLPFRLVLIYWELGVAVRLFDDAEVIDEMVTACFPSNGQQYPSLYLWAIEYYDFSTVELLEGSGFAGVWEGEYYLHLEDVTDFDISTFYEIYKEPSDTGCLQTPQERWFF